MREALRTVRVGALAVGFSAAVAVVLAAPAVAGVAEVIRGGQADVGSVVAWSGRVPSVLAGRLDLILRLVRCPTIENNT